MKTCLVIAVSLFLTLAPSEVGAYTPPSQSPLTKKEHSRIFFTEEDLSSIRQRISGYYKNEFQQFVDIMDSVASGSSTSGYQLYFDTRNLSFLCAIDPASVGANSSKNRQVYCDKAVEFALNISSSCEDSRHDFANWWKKGGCKMTPSISYDWTYKEPVSKLYFGLA